MKEAIGIGDRVAVRDRVWRVRNRQEFSPDASVYELEAMDGVKPRLLSLASPPDRLHVLPNENLTYSTSSIDAFSAWQNAHRLIASTLVQETGLLSGARFGRVALEAYQIAPVLRILSKPCPRLLIADDVGLGKTIEAGLILLELIARGRAKRILVVAPPGLLLQWQSELAEKFGLDFVLIENAAGLSRVQGELPAGVNPWDALPRVLTSMDFIKKETVRCRALKKPWDMVVVDEAHALAEAGTPTNPYRTQRTRLGHAMADNARGLLLLTATPHNGYPHSFRSLLELIEPSAATFHGGQKDIGRRIGSAMVRRMKAQIVRRDANGVEKPVFPNRFVEAIAVRLRPDERELLRKVASYCSRAARSAKDSEDAELVGFAMQIVKKRALSSRAALESTIANRLDALKQAEDETPPLRSEIRELQLDIPMDEASADRAAARVVRSAIPKEEKRRKTEIRALNGIRRLLNKIKTPDPKIEALIADIRSVQKGTLDEKVIIFTEYLDTLEAIRQALEEIPDLCDAYAILRGGMSGRQRRRVQQQFEKPHIRILLATDAASEGLNLQHYCRRIYHVELPWNPNRLEQRNGRVDRYGQHRNPQIRYLYYPDSPEDDVMHQLTVKIERMQGDLVSTPDILGVLKGSGEIESGLVGLDPEDKQIEAQKAKLVRFFEDRTADFIRNVKPLVSAGVDAASEIQSVLDLLDSANPLLPDDETLERLALDILPRNCVEQAEVPYVYRLQVPLQYRGSNVQPFYPMATFRRSVAVQYPSSDVEFITPMHPLTQAMAAEARKRLLLVFSSDRGLTPRRLAACRVGTKEPVSAIFTFLATISGGGGLIEEQLIAVRISTQLAQIGTSNDALEQALFVSEPGEVKTETLEQLFKEPFAAMAQAAADTAARELEERHAALQAHRAEQAEVLRRDLEADLADRLKELAEAEKRARGMIDDHTGQLFMFAEADANPTGFKARRAAAEAQADLRRKEISIFESVELPGPPRPLGALFLVPEGLS